MAANSTIRSEADAHFFLEYERIYVGRPSADEDLVERAITPNQCRLRDMTYAAPVYVDVRYTRDRSIVVKRGVQIGRVPIMLRSCKCVLVGKSEAELAKLRECTFDPGGYFVVKGVEKVVLIQEQLCVRRARARTRCHHPFPTTHTHTPRARAGPRIGASLSSIPRATSRRP